MLAMSDGLFAKKLAEVRESKGMTKYRLAKETGLSEAYIGRLEKGGVSLPSDDALAKLSVALSIDAGQLKAWAEAERLGEEGLAGLWKYAGGPMVRIEAAKAEIERLSAELDHLMAGKPTPETIARGNEVAAMLKALSDYLGAQGALVEKLAGGNAET